MQFLKKFTPRQIAWGAAGILLVIAVALSVAAVAATPRNVLTFAVMDVGQGDAIFVESPSGLQVLIDGGPNASILRELPKLMPYGDRTLDAVIETHPDADHISGLTDVLKRYNVKLFIDPGIPKPTATAQTLEHQVAMKNIPHVLARAGMVLDLGRGARLEILYPDKDVSHLSSSKVNEGGVVARLVYGESEVLLMADVPESVEEQLNASELKSDILKVGHHGSKTSTSDTLLKDVSPHVAIISVGADNRYGHPTAEVLERLNSFGIQIFRTDESGTIVYRSDGKTFVRVK